MGMTTESVSLWWISFLVDDTFCGACVVAGQDLIEAVERAKALGIHPGGTVSASMIPDNCREDFELHKDKFINKTEAELIFDTHEESHSIPSRSNNIIWN